MTKLFGTDGIRGVANRYPLDCETALKAGRSIAAFFAPEKAGRFLIGQDTRISGDMLAHALAAGITSMGHDACLAGVIPTPGVAYLAASQGFDAGIMVSASHNPFFDNGIKLFKADGYKLSDAQEQAIEKGIAESEALNNVSQTVQSVGRIHSLVDAHERYHQFLINCLGQTSQSFNGLSIVVDCSHGAASQMTGRLFEALGARVISIHDKPDGININDHCGSQHPKILAQRVVTEKANMGLAFDGDADRLIAVDEKGNVLTGDQVMAICAQHLQSRGELEPPTVVTTVMSNMGLGIALKKLGIEHTKSKVGDRYVMEEMRRTKAVLGGEDSGHMIFRAHHTTGDGILAGLKLIEAVIDSGQPLSELSNIMTVFPQCLINVDVQFKPNIESVPAIGESIAAVEKALGDQGRVLVRYSGTQPQFRVMVEGPTEEETRQLCRRIADVVAQEIG